MSNFQISRRETKDQAGQSTETVVQSTSQGESTTTTAAQRNTSTSNTTPGDRTTTRVTPESTATTTTTEDYSFIVTFVIPIQSREPVLPPGETAPSDTC